MTLFLLQIVGANPPHAVVRLPAGGKLELDFIASGAAAAAAQVAQLTDAFVGDVIARGVGLGRTEAHVEAQVRAALEVYLPQVRSAIADGLTIMVAGLKAETVQVIT